MTNFEAVIAAIQVTGWTQSSIEKTLIDANISPVAIYAPFTDTTIKKKIDLAAINVLKGMLAVQRVQEGGYEIEYSIEGIKLRIGYLEGLLGLPSAGPKIRNKSYQW